MEELSTGAVLTLHLLRGFCRGKKKCWPRQKTLAAETGKSQRSIRSYIAELVRAGLVVKKRTLRGNESYLEERQDSAGAERQDSAGAERQDSAGMKGSALMYELINTEFTAASAAATEAPQAAAACAQHKTKTAAASSSPLTPHPSPLIADAYAAFVAMGVRQAAIKGLVEPNPAFSCLAAAWMKRRLANRKLPMVDNRDGFARVLLTDPARYTWEKDVGGEWIPPDSDRLKADGQALAKKKEAAARSRSEELRQRQAVEATERWVAHWRGVYDAMNAAEQQALLKETRAAFPLLGHLSDTSWAFLHQAFRQLEARHLAAARRGGR